MIVLPLQLNCLVDILKDQLKRSICLGKIVGSKEGPGPKEIIECETFSFLLSTTNFSFKWALIGCGCLQKKVRYNEMFFYILIVTPKPVGLFSLNDASVKDILTPGDNKLILGDVDLTSGPGGK